VRESTSEMEGMKESEGTPMEARLQMVKHEEESITGECANRIVAKAS
jgi:hypothetical protein